MSSILKRLVPKRTYASLHVDPLRIHWAYVRRSIMHIHYPWVVEVTARPPLYPFKLKCESEEEADLTARTLMTAKAPIKIELK